MKDRDN